MYFHKRITVLIRESYLLEYSQGPSAAQVIIFGEEQWVHDLSCLDNTPNTLAMSNPIVFSFSFLHDDTHHCFYFKHCLIIWKSELQRGPSSADPLPQTTVQPARAEPRGRSPELPSGLLHGHSNPSGCPPRPGTEICIRGRPVVMERNPSGLPALQAGCPCANNPSP